MTRADSSGLNRRWADVRYAGFERFEGDEMAGKSFLSQVANTLVRGAKSKAGRQARRLLRDQVDKLTGQGRDSGSRGSGNNKSGGRKNAPTRTPGVGGDQVDFRGSGDAYYMDRGTPLPHFTYSPQKNRRADPGEVVWTWVPFEEDPSEGKDRPVLVLAETSAGVIGAQMTSRNRTDYFLEEDRFGRAWFDIGTGNWDREGRRSEVRLDRLLVIPRGTIRREGGRLDKHTFEEVVQKIRQVHEG